MRSRNWLHLEGAAVTDSLVPEVGDRMSRSIAAVISEWVDWDLWACLRLMLEACRRGPRVTWRGCVVAGAHADAVVRLSVGRGTGRVRGRTRARTLAPLHAWGPIHAVRAGPRRVWLKMLCYVML